MATFNLSRPASMYETGIGRGMGYRDSNQDILGFVHMLPARARERILDIAATQLSDGTCYHQYQPLTKKGNAGTGGDFYDDHLWLILSTCSYIKETGDLTILDAPVGYADKPGSKETILHHLETSIAHTMKQRGPHKLPLIGHADWNDCLNLNCFSTEPNESFQCAGDVNDSIAESVMIAGLLLYATRELEGLYTSMKRTDDAKRIDANYAEMLDAIETHAWDGEWYIRAFDAKGNPVGSKVCKEGKIFIESQAWCVLGGAGAPVRPRERAQAPLHAQRHHPATARLRDLLPRTRRGLQLPARLQGKRRHLLPQQHVDQPRLVPAGRRRPRPSNATSASAPPPRNRRSRPTAANPTSTPR